MAKKNNPISNFFKNHLTFIIVALSLLTCAVFVIIGHPAEDGSRTLDGNPAEIKEYTTKYIENAEDALYRLMNEDAPTDEETIKANDTDEEANGQGFYTTIDAILGRREPDGNTDNGLGWQCSKYTAYLATGKREYSSTHTDYGPVNGKDIASWLVKNYGFKYIDKPVQGAIGSGGFNTKYGHTAMYLYSTGTNTAMVNDANYVPLTVSTHNMNISGWVWVVPSSYNPSPSPTPTPTPTPTPVSSCKTRNVVWGDTMSKIMKECEGYVDWSKMNDYAKSWVSKKVKPNQSVYDGWHSITGVGLYAGDIIEKK